MPSRVRTYPKYSISPWAKLDLADDECKLAHASEFEKNVRMMTLSSDAPYAKESKEQDIIKAVITAHSDADATYLPTIREIADKQRSHRTFRDYF